MNVEIIIGDAGFPEALNDKIKTFLENKSLISVKTIGFAAKDHHKKNYVIVTIIWRKQNEQC